MTWQARIVTAILDNQLDDRGREDILKMVQSYARSFQPGGPPVLPPKRKK